MAMRNIIVLGDGTTHGGKVISAWGAGPVPMTINGKPVACIGDKVTCPRCKGTHTIIQGAEGPPMMLNGRLIAREGDLTSCGAKLLSGGQTIVTHGTEGGKAAKTATAAAATGGILTADVTPGITPALAQMLPPSPGGPAPQQVFDEQIKFVDKAGNNLADIGYKLYSGNQLLQSGRTDPNGLTSRLTTSKSTPISRAELTFKTVNCCGNLPRDQSAEMNVNVVIKGVSTNSTDLGSSFVKQEVEFHERPLTAGEIRMAQTVFNNGINYSKVKVHNHGYWLLMGLQPNNTAVAPNGEIYFPMPVYKADFSDVKSINDKQWFIHEMGHVWQYQLGFPVKLDGLTNRESDYYYTLDAKKKLCDYIMEQQCEIIAHYFSLKILSEPMVTERGGNTYYSTDLPTYEAVLVDFLHNPTDKSNLPKRIAF